MNADEVVPPPYILPSDVSSLVPQFLCQTWQNSILNGGRIRYYNETEEVVTIILLSLLQKLLDFLFKIRSVRSNEYALQFPCGGDNFGVGGRRREFCLGERNNTLLREVSGRRLAVVVDQKSIFPHKIQAFAEKGYAILAGFSKLKQRLSSGPTRPRPAPGPRSRDGNRVPCWRCAGHLRRPGRSRACRPSAA